MIIAAFSLELLSKNLPYWPDDEGKGQNLRSAIQRLTWSLTENRIYGFVSNLPPSSYAFTSSGMPSYSLPLRNPAHVKLGVHAELAI